MADDPVKGVQEPEYVRERVVIPDLAHPHCREPMGGRGMLPDGEAGMRPGRLPGPPLPRLAPPHDPRHGRPRLPDRPARPPAGHGESRNGSSQLIHLSLAEIRRLIITRLTNRQPTPVDHILHWSTWRRRRQHQARVSHYKRRGHSP
jgi:hypothetical protein